MVRTNSLKAWFLAARPKTLTAAAVPVMIGASTAWADTASARPEDRMLWVPTLLCLLFAWVMQINSNFVNDYFDFRFGNDDETRLGPKRACAEGWVTPWAMKVAIAITTLAGCAIGLPLILYGGWSMVAIGVACVVFCFLYTTLFSYLGLGDVLVLFFFGIVPVCCTYYVVLPTFDQTITLDVFLASVACGLVVDTLLVVNNYRDREGDFRSKKRTLVVRIGARSAEYLYLLLGAVPVALMMLLALVRGVGENYSWMEAANIFKTLLSACLYLVYLRMHYATYRELKRIHQGSELNSILGLTARNIFVFGLICCLSRIVGALPMVH